MSNRGEGKLFNDVDEPSQAQADHAKDLESDFGMLEAKRAEIVAADEEQNRIDNSGSGGRIVAAVEDGELSHRAAGVLDGEYLFAAAAGGLEDADLARVDDIEACAGITLVENQLASRVAPGDGMVGEEVQLSLREIGEDRHARQDSRAVYPGFRHSGIVAATNDCAMRAAGHRLDELQVDLLGAGIKGGDAEAANLPRGNGLGLRCPCRRSSLPARVEHGREGGQVGAGVGSFGIRLLCGDCGNLAC